MGTEEKKIMGTKDSRHSLALSFAPEDIFIVLDTGVKIF